MSEQKVYCHIQHLSWTWHVANLVVLNIRVGPRALQTLFLILCVIFVAQPRKSNPGWV